MNVVRLTRNPTLVTALLSAAAIVVYSTYRLTTVASAQTPSSLANELPEIVLNDLDGTPTALATWRGTPMLINYWATWCAPCLREIPMLKEFESANPSIQVVGIAYDRVEPVVEFAEEIEFNYPVLVGMADAMDAAAALGVQVLALPFTVYVAGDGAILGIHTGEVHAEHLEAFRATIEELEAGAIDRAAARERLAASG